MPDMTTDIFADFPFGQLALLKLAPVPENFRLYSAGWVGKKHTDRQKIRVTGAEFRQAKTGASKGMLSIMIKGTQRSVYVTKAEMQAQDSVGTK